MDTKSFMQTNSVKTKFLVLTLAAIATITGGLLAASFEISAKNSKTSNNSDARVKQNMQHDSGMMNHGSSMEMDLGPADANYDLRFVDAMRMHHQGAIEMAKAAQHK